jgi:Flp pilus assembly protein TadB
MIVVVALAAALAAGVDMRRVAVLAGAVYLPLVAAGLILLHWFRARPDDHNRPTLFCEGVASELRAGATLRDALATAATSVGTSPMSLSDPHGSMTEVAAKIAESFPTIGQELRLTVIAAARSGSDSAALFDEIGALALAQSEIRHEVRVATAPGRATALVLVGAPVLYLSSQLGTGGLAAFLASSQQRVVALIGLALFLAGLGGACAVLWRASR